jgi:hypothetical protein
MGCFFDNFVSALCVCLCVCHTVCVSERDVCLKTLCVSGNIVAYY